MHELLDLDEDATLLWVGYHPVWMIWGDDRLRIDLQRHYLTGESTALEKYRAAGHVARVTDARGPDDVLECLALSRLDDDWYVWDAVAAAVDRQFGRRMIFRFERQDTPGRRWARWMIRRRRMSPGQLAQRLDTAVRGLLKFGALSIDPDEETSLTRARIEALYRAAGHRAEISPVAADMLGKYAEGGEFPPRRLAAERLGRLPARVCRERLRALMQHPNPIVRENAAYAVPRKKPIVDRADLTARLFVMLEDPEVGVAAQAMTTLIDIIAGGTRMARFKAFAAVVAADPAHRLYHELREAVAWSNENGTVRPGFKKRIGL